MSRSCRPPFITVGPPCLPPPDPTYRDKDACVPPPYQPITDEYLCTHYVRVKDYDKNGDLKICKDHPDENYLFERARKADTNNDQCISLEEFYRFHLKNVSPQPSLYQSQERCARFMGKLAQTDWEKRDSVLKKGIVTFLNDCVIANENEVDNRLFSWKVSSLTSSKNGYCPQVAQQIAQPPRHLKQPVGESLQIVRSSFNKVCHNQIPQLPYEYQVERTTFAKLSKDSNHDPLHQWAAHLILQSSVRFDFKGPPLISQRDDLKIETYSERAHLVYKDDKLITVIPTIIKFGNTVLGSTQDLKTRGTEKYLKMGEGFVDTPKQRTLTRSSLTLEYEGLFKVRFNRFPETIHYNDVILELLQKSRQGKTVPAELLRNMRLVIVEYASKHYHGLYLKDKIKVYHKSDLSTFIHELVHHWDLSVTKQRGSNDDPSQIFYGISWGSNNKCLSYDSRDFRGYVFQEKDLAQGHYKQSCSCLCEPRSKRDKPYGMQNKFEDIATAGEDYYIKGGNYRRHARQQMSEDNFEPAVKYLFMKHIIYAGQEHDLTGDNPSLTFHEVQDKIREALTNRTHSPIAEKTVEALEAIYRASIVDNYNLPGNFEW